MPNGNRQNYLHNLSDIGTGQELENYLIKLVEGTNWTPNDFYTFKDSTSKTVFTIKPHAIPSDQPGNGWVDFVLIDGNGKWSEFSDDVKNSKFKNTRKNFLKNPLNGSNYSRKDFAANVLMQFEIARRVKDPNYPIDRDQTRDAIDEVMSTDDQNYEDKAEDLKKMFAGKYRYRRATYNRIMSIPEEDELVDTIDKLKIGN